MFAPKKNLVIGINIFIRRMKLHFTIQNNSEDTLLVFIYFASHEFES